MSPEHAAFLVSSFEKLATGTGARERLGGDFTQSACASAANILVDETRPEAWRDRRNLT